MDEFYYDGHRKIHEKFDSRLLADRLNEVNVHDELTDEDHGFIEVQDILIDIEKLRSQNLSPNEVAKPLFPNGKLWKFYRMYCQKWEDSRYKCFF